MSMSALSAGVPVCLVCLSEARSLIPEFCHKAESLLAVRGGGSETYHGSTYGQLFYT
jgi:hypothetical protein